MLEDVADLARAQPDIDRNEHTAARWHRLMELQHRGHVRAQGSDAIVAVKSPTAERGREAVHPFAQLRVRAALLAMHDRDTFGVDGRAAINKRRWVELGPANAGVRRPRRGQLRSPNWGVGFHQELL